MIRVVVGALVLGELENGFFKWSILLQKRSAHREFPGHWECPGGKVEPGETDVHALQRELREELGIEATVDLPPFFSCSFTPPEVKEACELVFYEIFWWAGKPQALDADGLYWHGLDFKADPACGLQVPGNVAAMDSLRSLLKRYSAEASR